MLYFVICDTRGDEVLKFILRALSNYVWLLFIPIGLLVKPYVAKRIIKKSKVNDPLFDEIQMKGLAEKLFRLIHQSLAERDTSLIADYVTEHMFRVQKSDVEDLISKHEIYRYSNIIISSIQLIGCESYKDKQEDTFSVGMAGRMVSYTTDEWNADFLNDSKQYSLPFSVILDFVRDGDRWYLHKFFEGCDEEELILSENHFEN